MEFISFDDVLISPKFSFVRSRKDVDTSVVLLGSKLTTPVISSNMDTITTAKMACAIQHAGAIGCLPRFSSIEDNVKDFEIVKKNNFDVMVSIGLGDSELERAEALINAGATRLVIDVAHGAQISVVEQYNKLREKYGEHIGIIVGNFATAKSINDFNYHSGHTLEATKVGIGNGAACTTRIKTGVGIPQLHAITDCASTRIPLICDGGCKNSGDVAKAIAAGSTAVMVGRMFAGTVQTPNFYKSCMNGEILSKQQIMDRADAAKYSSLSQYLLDRNFVQIKIYRGSASAMSYQVQGKSAEWRVPEGEAYEVPEIGQVSDVVQEINGGLRSAMSYVGANTIEEFQNNSEFVLCSTLSVGENHAHGK